MASGSGVGSPYNVCPTARKRLNANNFGVGQFELTDIHAGKPFSKFTDAVKFLLTSFGEERVVKFRCDSVDEAAANGQVVFQQRIVGSHGLVNPHSFGNGDEGEGGGRRVAQHSANVKHPSSKAFQFLLHGVAFLSSKEHGPNAARDTHQSE